MKWLYVTTGFPWPLTHGTYLRVYHMARTLVAGGDSVTLLAGGEDAAGQAAYAEAGVSLLFPPGGDSAPRQGRCRHSPYDFDPAMAKTVSQHAGGHDAVVLWRADAMQYAPEAAAAPAVALEMMDDPVLEERRRLWRDLRPRVTAWRLKFFFQQRRYEQAFLPHVGLTLFVSETDAASFGRRHRHAESLTLPNGVQIDFYAPPADHPAPAGPPTFTFLGNLRHKPNEDAALFFLRTIAPRIRQQLPAARFCVVGGNPPPALTALAGADVTVTGFVPDVRPYLWEATAVVLPMRMGTGIKNKLLEAWAAGSAVVATPRACQGVPAVDGRNLFVAGSPEALASAAARLAGDASLRQSLSCNARQTVQDHLTWTAIAAQLRQTVQARSCRASRSA